MLSLLVVSELPWSQEKLCDTSHLHDAKHISSLKDYGYTT